MRAATELATDQVVALLLKDRQVEAIALLVDQVRPNQRKWIDALDEVVRRQEKQADAAAEAALRSYHTARLLTAIITALALLLAAAAGWTVTGSITTPLREAVALARRVAQGDLTGEVALRSRDEAGQLMAALKEMHDSLATGTIIMKIPTISLALCTLLWTAGAQAATPPGRGRRRGRTAEQGQGDQHHRRQPVHLYRGGAGQESHVAGRARGDGQEKQYRPF